MSLLTEKKWRGLFSIHFPSVLRGPVAGREILINPKIHSGRNKKVILYGSYAGETQSPESDIDLLIVIDKEDFRLRRAIVDLSFDYFLKYKIDISPKVISKKDFEENLQYPFMKAVVGVGRALV